MSRSVFKQQDAVSGSGPNIVNLIFSWATQKKALYTALVVGTILAVINHGDIILVGEMPSLLKIGITYCVPFCVTIWGIIVGYRSQANDKATP